MSPITLTGMLRNRMAVCLLMWATATGFVAAADTPRDVAQEQGNHQLVLMFYERFFNQRDLGAASVVADDYRQHNPLVADGKAGMLAFLGQHFKNYPQAKFRVVRSAAYGDLVYLHIHATRDANDLGRAVVDIFRVQDGRIVEHWDVVQPVPAQAQNGNTMF